MNKKQRQQLENKIKSVEETIKILKHQESNLLEAIQTHSYDHNNSQIKGWVNEIIIGCKYIVRLEQSLEIMKKSRPNGGNRG